MYKKDELWMFQIIETDTVYVYKFPELRIIIRTIEEMKDMIKSFHELKIEVKIQKCKKMTNADWIYKETYEKWWNDKTLITPDCLEHR